MKRDLWMPLNVGDYLADTGHLSTAQHGAYMLLIMHYWRKKNLPTEDNQLAAIAKLPLSKWLRMRGTIQAFFFEGWRHKRIEIELQKRLEVSEKRAVAGARGGSRTHMNNFTNEANATFCSSMTHKKNLTTTTVAVERGLSKGNLSLSEEAIAGISGRKQ